MKEYFTQDSMKPRMMTML